MVFSPTSQEFSNWVKILFICKRGHIPVWLMKKTYFILFAKKCKFVPVCVAYTHSSVSLLWPFSLPMAREGLAFKKWTRSIGGEPHQSCTYEHKTTKETAIKLQARRSGALSWFFSHPPCCQKLLFLMLRIVDKVAPPICLFWWMHDVLLPVK